MRVRLRVRVGRRCVCACVCVRAYVCVCVCVCVCVLRAWFSDCFVPLLFVPLPSFHLVFFSAALFMELLGLGKLASSYTSQVMVAEL